MPSEGAREHGWIVSNDIPCCIYGLFLTAKVSELQVHYLAHNTVSGASKAQQELPVCVPLRTCPVSLSPFSQQLTQKRLEFDWNIWILLD